MAGTAITASKTKKFLGVAQLVARYLGVVEAASSSLVTQTSLSGQHFGACPLLFFKFTPSERIKSLTAAALPFLFFC